MNPENPIIPPNYWGKPSLPEGDSGLPSTAIFQDTQLPVSDGNITDQSLARFNHDEREFIREWYPIVWGKPSHYLDGTVVNTHELLLQHARAYYEHQEQVARKVEDKDELTARRAEKQRVRASRSLAGDRWLEWQNQCRLRKEWIEGKTREWKARVAARKVALEQWDAYVEAARKECQEARLVPPPARPEG
jgi:hypothetical protein